MRLKLETFEIRIYAFHLLLVPRWCSSTRRVGNTSDFPSSANIFEFLIVISISIAIPSLPWHNPPPNSWWWWGMTWMLSPAAQREIDIIIERQNTRARGQCEADTECRTPPYTRAARAARAARAVPSSQGEECGGDDDPIATLAARQGILPSVPTHPITMHIAAYHAALPSVTPHQQFLTWMMLNLHLGNAMQSRPSVPPEAWGGSRH